MDSSIECLSPVTARRYHQRSATSGKSIPASAINNKLPPTDTESASSPRRTAFPASSREEERSHFDSHGMFSSGVVTTGLTSSSEDLYFSDGYAPPYKGPSHTEDKADILKTLADMNWKLVKLDALELMMGGFKGEFSALQSRVNEVSSSMSSLKSDLQQYNEKWEASVAALSGRVSQNENEIQTLDKKQKQDKIDLSKNISLVQENTENNISKFEKRVSDLENKWEQYQLDLSKNLSVAQESIDTNSKKIIEMEAKTNCYGEKWKALDTVENRVKNIAEDKFTLLKDALQDNLMADLSAKVSVIQNTASTSISEGISKVKTELKHELTGGTHTTKNLEAGQNNPIPSKLSKLKAQAFAKRHNLIFFGLPEGDSVDGDIQNVQSFLTDRMSLQGIQISSAYRLGSSSTTGNRTTHRPLVVRFKNIQDRWLVWNGKGSILFVQNSPVWIHEDLPKQLREENRILQRIAKTARRFPDKYKEIRIKDYKISIDGKTYSLDKPNLLPNDLSPAQVYTPRSKEAVIFFTKSSPLSNHFVRPFKLGDKSFTSVEQYLALQRATLVGNSDLASRAMETNDPADHKVILNTLYNNRREEWISQAPELILPAVTAKFQQNEDLADFLIDTHPLPIGEASKNSIWGIGLSLDDRRALDPSQWLPDGNLLGNTLSRF